MMLVTSYLSFLSLITCKAILFTTALAGKIDTHIHAIPPLYLAALQKEGYEDMPAWSLEATQNYMKDSGTSLAILSLSTPGVGILGICQEARNLARTLNKQFGDIVTHNSTNSTSFGFFGVLPDWQDVEGTIKEIDYLLGVQKLAAGVIVYTSYGDKLLGDPAYKSIWARLQKYKALVFIHPSGINIVPAEIGPALPQYVVDFLWGTSRAAVDLVMTGTMTASPDVDIILAHAGGTVPYIGTRAIQTLFVPAVAATVPITQAQATIEFARFYYDVALSTSAAQLDGMLDFSDGAHVLWGSDFPYVPEFFIINLEAPSLAHFQSNNTRGSKLAPDVLSSNSIGLLKKHSPSHR